MKIVREDTDEKMIQLLHEQPDAFITFKPDERFTVEYKVLDADKAAIFRLGILPLSDNNPNLKEQENITGVSVQKIAFRPLPETNMDDIMQMLITLMHRIDPNIVITKNGDPL